MRQKSCIIKFALKISLVLLLGLQILFCVTSCTIPGFDNVPGNTEEPNHPDNPSNPNEPDSHTCSFTFLSTVEPTCTEGGYDIYKCACGNKENRIYYLL